MDEFVILKCINALNDFFNANHERLFCWYKAKQYSMFDYDDVIAITYLTGSEPLFLVTISDLTDCIVLTNEFISAGLINEVSEVIKGVISNESGTER